MNTFGELQLTVNSQTAGSLLTDLPTDVPLWVIIDVYGSTQSVQFVQVQGTINILNFFFSEVNISSMYDVGNMI